MADFWQGSISTLHLLKPGPARHLDEPLQQYGAGRPLTVVLPCHSRELGTDAFANLVKELADTPWVSRVVVGLDQAGQAQYEQARRELGPLGQRSNILWWDAPEWAASIQKIKETVPELPSHGKGRNVWLCLGWLHQRKNQGVTALLDCDVINFNRSLLARLVYPVMRPDLGYQFSKGYYPRFSERLHGRLTRLLLEPLLRAWEEIHKHSPLTTFLQSFRYALAGEMAFSSNWGSQMTFPAGYGLEIGMLGQVFDLIPRNAVCQSCLTEAHDHRHQDLQGPAGGEPTGLEASALEVISTLVHLLGGKPASQSALETAFRTQVCRALHHSVTNAAINDLPYNLEDESRAARLFGKCIARAATHNLVWLPAWKDLDVALPAE